MSVRATLENTVATTLATGLTVIADQAQTQIMQLQATLASQQPWQQRVHAIQSTLAPLSQHPLHLDRQISVSPAQTTQTHVQLLQQRDLVADVLAHVAPPMADVFKPIPSALPSLAFGAANGIANHCTEGAKGCPDASWHQRRPLLPTRFLQPRAYHV